MSDLEEKIDEINKVKRQEHRKERVRENISKFREEVSSSASEIAEAMKDYIKSKKAKVKKFFDDLDEKKKKKNELKETYERYLQLADELKDEDYLIKSGNSQEIDGEVVIAKGEVAPIIFTTYDPKKSKYIHRFDKPIRDVSYEGFIDTDIFGVSQKVYVNIRNVRWEEDHHYSVDGIEMDFYEGFVRMPNGQIEKISCKIRSNGYVESNDGTIYADIGKWLFLEARDAYYQIKIKKEALERKEREEGLSEIPERVPDDC